MRQRDAGHAVHLDRDADAMPVDRSGLVEFVDEVDDDAVTDRGADERAWEAAVVGPGLYLAAGRHFDLGDLGREVDFDDVRIGIRVGRLGQLDPSVPIGRGVAWWRLGPARRHGCGPRQREEGCREDDGPFPG